MNYLSLLCVEDEGKICEEVTLNLNFEEEKRSVLYEWSTGVYTQTHFMKKTAQTKLDLWRSSLNLKQHERKQCKLSTNYCSILSCFFIIICGRRQMDEITFLF